MKEKKDRRLVAVRRIFFPWLLEFLLVLIRKGEEEEKKEERESSIFKFFPYPFGMP